MKDAEFEVQKRRIVDLIERWHDVLGLGWWRITHAYSMETIRPNDAEDSGSIIANCRPDWRYMRATITWNMPLVEDQDDAMLEKIFVHELMHIFLHEMREGELHHEERVAQTLANAFLWLRDALTPDKSEYGGYDG